MKFDVRVLGQISYSFFLKVKSLEPRSQACTFRLPQHKEFELGCPNKKPIGGVFQLAEGLTDPTQQIPTLVDGSTEVSFTLLPEATVTVLLCFCPRVQRQFNCSLQIWLRELSEKHCGRNVVSAWEEGMSVSAEPYMELIVEGEGVNPAIHFDRNEVCFKLQFEIF
jgi:hypothetical protein